MEGGGKAEVDRWAVACHGGDSSDPTYYFDLSITTIKILFVYDPPHDRFSDDDVLYALPTDFAFTFLSSFLLYNAQSLPYFKSSAPGSALPRVAMKFYMICFTESRS